ncbi:MAG: PP2C family protein-serine/threonine phosphatase [Nocardioides sp.]
MTDVDVDVPEEERRQRAVESLGILDTSPRDRLDRITRLARTALGVPLSSVTVLDRDRAFFVSAQGFDVREADRTETFCDATQRDGEETVVADARLDPRFADLDLVRSGALRFYAGEPLRDRSGTVLATFCIYDSEPRTLEGEDLVTFRDLAAWAQQELLASEEMARAGEVQASMLPQRGLRRGPWEIDGMCVPALAVGGDFYDFGVDNDVLHLGLGDVMGKGTGAALVGAGVRSSLRQTHAAVTAGVDLGIVATQVARRLVPDLERSQSFVTFFEAALELDDGTLRYVDAGMGLCLVARADGSVEQLRGEDRPMGILPDDHWTEHETTLGPGDRLLLFSDGVLDLIEDPDVWLEPLGDLLHRASTMGEFLADMQTMARRRVALDDVTVVTVFRDEAEE